ncbi:glycoside hydrolase family 6 protein [Kitasatospora sp. NPDC002227]|uniref:glycoside hydrolase family 6 protein n=1 Tax=Kitasatospora sp. NPDC002227 TaxID=3154773 RepID=UPI00331C29B1
MAWAGLAGLVVGVAAGCTSAPAAAPPPSRPAPAAVTQPAGQLFYVSDQSSAAKELATRSASGSGPGSAAGSGPAADLAALGRIARQPSALWLAGSDARAKAEDLTIRAEAAGRTALLVAYDIPHRDCGQFSAGGAADAPAYRAWIDGLSAALADRAAWIVLEPDAVAHTLDSCAVPAAEATERYALLSYAVGVLKKHPKVRVYVDAGNAGWVKDPGQLAEALRSAGVGQADGFAVNVSNFYTTEQSSEFGAKLSAALGGSHFVIDTSRNGNGPLSDRDWCNPPGRALGEPPTTATGRAGVDAYLWIKNPGESDGDCGRGEPPAGQFWLPYAVGLASAGR